MIILRRREPSSNKIASCFSGNFGDGEFYFTPIAVCMTETARMRCRWDLKCHTQPRLSLHLLSPQSDDTPSNVVG